MKTKTKLLTGILAICATASMAITASAASPTSFAADVTDPYQSAEYCDALSALKQAEQEYAEQKKIFDAEHEAYAKEDKSKIITHIQRDEYDFAPVIGEYQPSPYWDSAEALKLADLEYSNICEKLGVERQYESDFIESPECRKKRELKQNDVDLFTASQSSKLLHNLYQVPQERDYWCGYAAIKSLLDHEGVKMTQTEIAEAVWYTDEPCPWYTIDGSSTDQFPVSKYLRGKTGFLYIPYPMGAAGSTVLDVSEIKPRVVSTLRNSHGVLACGESYRTYDEDNSHLPGYPYESIVHWIALRGYENDGSKILVADPAKSPVISWSDKIKAYYPISVEKLASFATVRGIMW